MLAQPIAPPPPGATTLYPSPADRLGFGVARGQIANYDVATLGAGWYYNWSVGVDPVHPAGLAYAHLIRLPINDMAATRAAVAQATQNDPGALWLISNEPDVATMDNVLPETYAQDYYQLYHLIKAHDPTAVVAPGGIVMPTALRLCYLNKILHFYERMYGTPLPADAWHIHNYVLNEQRGKLPGVPPGFCSPYGVIPGLDKHDDMSLFGSQVVAMRQWMSWHGYRDKPLIISEYGILYPQQRGFDYYRVRDFLYASFDYLLDATDPTIGYLPDDNHLVQAWNWYSLDDTNFAGSGLTWGALFDPVTKYRLPMGNAWAGYVTDNNLHVPYARVSPTAIRLEGGNPIFYGEAAPVTVRAMVRNRGNAPADKPFTVAIYANVAGGGNSLLTSQTVPGLAARFDGVVWVEAPWTLPATDTWQLTAQISGTTQTLTVARRIDLHLDTLEVAPANYLQVSPGETTTLTLTATVANYGNIGVRDVEVRFREGSQLLGVKHIAELPALATASARWFWDGVGAGTYDVSAVASLPDNVPEDDTTDNQVSQTVVVVSHRLNLPLTPGNGSCATSQEYNLAQNGGFETGDFTGWQVVGAPIVREDPEHVVDGVYHAWLGMRDDAHDEIYQTVTVPEKAICVIFLYAWGIYTTDTCDGGSPRDQFVVSLRDVNGQTLEVLETRSECDSTEFWQGRAVDLHAYAGKTVQVHFKVDTDDKSPSYVALDDVHVQVWGGE